MIKADDKWQNIESPGYPDPGYDVGERCSWIITVEKGDHWFPNNAKLCRKLKDNALQ